MIRLNKTLRAFVQLAFFARKHNIDPADLAELVALAEDAFRCGERNCNYPEYQDKSDKAHTRFRDKALSLGFGAEFHGLWPTLTRDGQDISLPGL